MEDGMTTHNSASHAVQKSTGVEARPIADFHPSVWGDYFLNYIADDEETKAFMAKHLQELKEEVRKELQAVAGKSLELLNFIDAIQRLGVAYHFEEEIEDALQKLKAMCGAYMVEARWRNQKCFPTLDEYLNEAAIVSFGYNLATTVCYLGMGELATKKTFDWASQNPNVVKASGIIGRLMDDMASHEFEQTRDHVPSTVECYKVSEKQVRDELDKRVTNAWKDVNQALIRPTVMPSPLLTQILNLCQAMDVIYKGEDTYTFANRTMKNNIAMILTDPIPI
ncbi:hypothetical protein Ancab_008619 [Ancistrocladus abbreviatus]